MKSPAASLLLQGGDLFLDGTILFTYSEAPIKEAHDSCLTHASGIVAHDLQRVDLYQ